MGEVFDHMLKRWAKSPVIFHTISVFNRWKARIKCIAILKT